MLMRSEATARSSSSSSPLLSSMGSLVPAAVERVLCGSVGSGDEGGNQVEALGMGGAWSSGYWASWTIFLKPT